MVLARADEVIEQSGLCRLPALRRRPSRPGLRPHRFRARRGGGFASMAETEDALAETMALEKDAMAMVELAEMALLQVRV